MMTQLNDTQREQLSAYLDKRLSIPETVAFEKQLAEDAELTAELHELQMVRSMLNDLPAVRPPRSFTLDPVVYAPKQVNWSWMRWATVLGAFVLMLTVGLVIGNLSFGAQSVAPELSMSAAKPEALSTEELTYDQSGSAPAPTTQAMATEPAMVGGAMPAPEATREKNPLGMAEPTRATIPSQQPIPPPPPTMAPAASTPMLSELSSATEVVARDLQSTPTIAGMISLNPVVVEPTALAGSSPNSDVTGSNEEATDASVDRLEVQETAPPMEQEQNTNTAAKETPSNSVAWLWLLGLLGSVGVVGAIVVLRNRRKNYE